MKPTAHCSRKERKWVRQCDTNSICVDNHPRGAEWSDVELAACDGDIAAWGQLVEGLGFRVWDIFDIVARVLLPSNRLKKRHYTATFLILTFAEAGACVLLK